MELRLLRASLWRKRGTVALAALAVAIGGSVAAALLQVSGDVGVKLTRELRALGPNLLVVPADVPDAEPPAALGGSGVFLDQRMVRERLAAAGLEGAPLLIAAARVGGQTVEIVGADIPAALRLHPSWKISGAGEPPALIGARLARRIGFVEGASLSIEFADGATLVVLHPRRLESGGPDDEACWLPLAQVQTHTGRANQLSLAQARVEGGEGALRQAVAAIERGGGLRALPLHALAATEGDLLERMRRLMTLVTVAALISAGLCAFGTLTDLALDRRHEIALLKALGASRRDIVRRFVAESLAIGLIGGLAGWLIGLFFAQVIGREVFHAAVALRWEVPPQVIALSMAVAALAGLGPIRLALSIEPATALKGD